MILDIIDLIALPIEEPTLIFFLVLMVILLSPLLLERFKIPGLIGLILAGVMLGEDGSNILVRDKSIELFSTVGLLYIMFMAGLEIDLNEFKKNRNRSIVFGSISFTVPLALGILVALYFLKFDLYASLLLASMFASHTLLSYPIASNLGLSKSKAVNIVVGGTIITDTGALLVLAIVAGMVKEGGLDGSFWVQLGLSVSFFVGIMFFIFPIIARKFFKTVEGNVSQYIFVLAMVFFGANLAVAAQMQPIIGAFFTGLALNSLIPKNSALMNRIAFVGNALFIPFFLIGTGMLVDVSAFFSGGGALLIAGTMLFVALFAKILAAYITQRFFKLSAVEGQLMMGLSSAQAAATLAVVLVGVNLEIFTDDVLNGTIIMILGTALFSSILTSKAGTKQAIIEAQKEPEEEQGLQRILLPIANPESIRLLVDLAVMIKQKGQKEPIYPLAVVADDDTADKQVLRKKEMLDAAVVEASATDTIAQVITRVDSNIPFGISRAIKEFRITEVVIGWNADITNKDKMFGSVLDYLINNSDEMLLITKHSQPLNTMKKLFLVIPSFATQEIGFSYWVQTVKTLANQIGTEIIIYCQIGEKIAIDQAFAAKSPKVDTTYRNFDNWDDFHEIADVVKKDDLIVVISSRKGTPSYNPFMDILPKTLSDSFESNSFMVIYPQQYAEKQASVDEQMAKARPDNPISWLRKRLNRYLED
ncbi:MAG: cation:proton antiporter [Cyclobacteriaceae bacterium]|nr:cation:proton antiporter [Cyclobacteriaceae bacterium]MCH8516532.1 cation:proton antiporter [Cyclobacteriaceae bacterium]